MLTVFRIAHSVWAMPRRVLITGPHDYRDRAFVWHCLDELDAEDAVECVIHGTATGVDSFGRDWALARNVEQSPFPAQWDKIDDVPKGELCIRVNKFGKPYNAAAGSARNMQMLREGCPTDVAVFPCERRVFGTPGTIDMHRRALSAERAGQALQIHVFKHPLAKF